MARRRSVVRRAGTQRMSAGLIAGVVLVIGAIALIGFGAGREGGAIQSGDGAAAVAARTATAPARAAEGFFGRLGAMWTATAQLEQLRAENRDLQAWKALAERLAERNARYETLLRMPPDAFGGGADLRDSIAAQLVLDSGGPFARTLVANAGADHGVHVGYIAVNELGLVGRVVSVGRRSSRILMLDDYNSRIPVMGEASRVRAILVGQAANPPELLTRPFNVETPRLDFIVGAASLREGERVITSGDGGLYPRGIPIGAAHRGRDGVWRVALAASQQPIDFVRILPFSHPERPEDSPVDEAAPPATPEPAVRNAVAPATAIQPAVTPPPRRAAAPPVRTDAAPASPAPATTAQER